MPILLNVLFLIICVLLILVVLLQRGRGGGLGAAFGGSGGSAFGTRTGDVFTWVTIILTALFLLLAIGTAVAYRPDLGKVATPVFDPPAGPIEGPVRVAIRCATQDASIHYTLDGSEPTPKAVRYTDTPIRATQGMTIKARAFRAGSDDSDIATATYTQPQVAAPTFDPPAGPLAGATAVVINTTTEGAAIYFTTDGSEPTQDATAYSEPIDVTPPMTLKARGFHPDPNILPSEIRQASYVPLAAPATQPDGDTTEPGNGE